MLTQPVYRTGISRIHVAYLIGDLFRRIRPYLELVIWFIKGARSKTVGRAECLNKSLRSLFAHFPCHPAPQVPDPQNGATPNRAKLKKTAMATECACTNTFGPKRHFTTHMKNKLSDSTAHDNLAIDL